MMYICLLSFLLTASSIAMETAQALSNPFTRTPTDVDIEILCKLVPTDTSCQESIKSIRALKNAMLTCKKLHKASQNPKVADYFMRSVTYDPKNPVYMAKTINKELETRFEPELQLKQARIIALDTLGYHRCAVEKQYIDFSFCTPNEADDEAYDLYIAHQKQTSQIYKDALYPSYQTIYAALNINTPQTRALFLQDVKRYPHKAYHALMLACLYRNSLVPELLQAGTSANSVHRDVKAHAPINIAVLFGLTNVVEHFLIHKTHTAYVDIDRLDFTKESPFTRALRMGHSQIIKLLAQKVSMRFWIMSAALPQEYYNTSCYANEYIERFCPNIDSETRAFVKKKSDEQRALDRKID